MIPQAQIDSTIKQLFNTIEFTAEPRGLYDPLRYMISIGGKRLRPKLCMLAYSLYKSELGSEILEPAAALEVYHTFTLIHDDIMDKSPLRRGQQTVWKKWNEDTAILSGDVMCMDAYRRMALAPKACMADALEVFGRTAVEVCDGQQYDMDFENETRVAMADYMKMVGLKTAVLIACSAKVGAIVAGAPEDDCDLLYDFGYQVGLAFQVADDYLDTYGDEKVFGKPIGGDIVNGKKTWLLTHALDKADAQGQPELAAELLSAMQMPAEDATRKAAKIARVKALYEKLGVAEDAKAEIVRLHNLAKDATEKLTVGAEEKAVLTAFAASLLERAN